MKDLNLETTTGLLFDVINLKSNYSKDNEIQCWPSDIIVGSTSKILPCCGKKVNIVVGIKIKKKRCHNCNRTFYPSYSASEYLSNKLGKQAITIVWEETPTSKSSRNELVESQLKFDF
jgi:hypothetical protein